MTLLYLEDFAPGQTWTSASQVVTADEIIEFATRYDPQPFHTDPEAAAKTFFGGLAASGWHTAALTMGLMVRCDFKPASGLVGAGVDELKWPNPLRPGDEIHVDLEVQEVRRSTSKPDRGIVCVAMRTLNQDGKVMQSGIANVVVPARATR
ncbi:MAG TPA: MaoC family dehydratase [Rhodocyclaceae bacterium]|nr:MaoC family dehydratase [Rhodocyclaceae bacterium]